MAEYGREERNQLSRAISNNKLNSRQLKGLEDNRFNLVFAGMQKESLDSNNIKQLKKQNKKPYSYNFEVSQMQATQVIQRITEEDMAQAVINILPSAERHDYTDQSLEAIIRHRFGEIRVGHGEFILLGQGTEEGARFGRLVYNCEYRNGIYYINAFHAHGGGTTFNNGY